MTPDEQELRQTSDGFLARVERLRDLEVRKREAVPGSPLMLRLTEDVEALARETLEWASRQTDLAHQTADEGSAQRQPIATVPPRPLSVVLADWRAAERAMEAHAPGSLEWETARADVERLRDEYARGYLESRNT